MGYEAGRYLEAGLLRTMMPISYLFLLRGGLGSISSLWDTRPKFNYSCTVGMATRKVVQSVELETRLGSDKY